MIRHSTVEGVESYDAFTHSELTGWTVAVAAPVGSIEAPAYRAVQLAAAGMLLAAFAALGVAVLFGRRLVAAIKLASDAAILLGEGGKPPVIRSSIVELQNLVKLVTLSAAELLSEIEFDLRALGLAHLNRSVVHLVFSHHLGEAPK